MRCEDARAAILTAGPSELAKEAATPLARHLDGCAACRRRAEIILTEQSQLARTLDRIAGRDSGSTDERRAAGGAEKYEDRAPPTRRRSPVTAALAAGALAAAAALLVWQGPGLLTLTSGTGYPVVVVGDRSEPASFGVDVPPDGRMAVFQTGDPRFVVVWQVDPTN